VGAGEEVVTLLCRTGGRPPRVSPISVRSRWWVLRSSDAPGGDRHEQGRGTRCDSQSSRRATATFRGLRASRPSPNCEPRSSWRTTATAETNMDDTLLTVLRSSATPQGDRHRAPLAAPGAGATCCDPRSPQRATALLAACRPPSPTGCDPRSPRRATATSAASGPGSPGSCCDPRSPRRATATGGAGHQGAQTITLRSLVAPEDDRHSRRPGRPRPPEEDCDPRSPRESDLHPLVGIGFVC
jgi:hypothetical protein